MSNDTTIDLTEEQIRQITESIDDMNKLILSMKEAGKSPKEAARELLRLSGLPAADLVSMMEWLRTYNIEMVRLLEERAR